MTKALRVIGVSATDIGNWSHPLPQNKWAQFFGALARHFELVDVAHPVLSRFDIYLNLARSFSPHPDRWRYQAFFNPWLVMRRTQAIQRVLDRHAGSYDLIVQLGMFCEPGLKRKVPYVLYADNTMALTQRLYLHPSKPLDTNARMLYEAKICQEACLVFTTSEYARRSIVDDYGCSSDLVVTVGEGANQMLPELGAKDYTTPRVIFVGMDFLRKGGGVLLQAWPIVREHVPTAELILAGPSRKPLRRLPPGVHWVGRVDRSYLDELYQSASIFTLPSLFDPSPLVLLEAMGYGLPCVSTTCCAIPEIVRDGVTGFLVPTGDASALSSALISLLTRPDTAAAMGRAAHKHVLQERSWHDVAERIAAMLGPTLDVSASEGSGSPVGE